MHLVEGGDYQEAMRQLEQVGKVAFEFKNRFLYLEHQKFWAYLAWDMGEFGLAAQYCREVLEFRESLPAIPLMRAIYFYIRICLSQGDLSQLKTSLREFFQRVTQPWQTFKAIQVLGILAARGGQLQRAATLFGAQDLLWEQGGRYWYRLTPRERSENEPALAAARAALGKEAFAAAWEAGRAMTDDQILQLARECIDDVLP
jgi:hypothetical protein